MAELAKQLPLTAVTEHEPLEIKERIFKTHTQELVIGLCGPIGTEIHLVADCLKDVLSATYQYECVVLRMSDLIRRYATTLSISTQDSAFINRQKLIEAGNDLRKANGPSILAELAVNEIAVNRERNRSGEDFGSRRICYIIDSFKNKEELQLFQLIYSEIFYFIGVYSNIESRVKNLQDAKLGMPEIYTLIDRDSGEEINFGQKVTDTFIEADFFLRVDNNSRPAIEAKIRKYLHLIFSSEIITPMPDETAMYLAYAAAGNSACLSRQVGASITDKAGGVLAVGWNDVPKAGGGVYHSGDGVQATTSDKRCLSLGEGVCFNDQEKRTIAQALVKELIDKGLVDGDQAKEALDVVLKSRIKELIEFSRAVHAEMLAIISAAQSAGQQMVGGKLFCTTYPCHNCARHIIAAGIKEVYYIEPYRKSLATKLHDDAITEDEAKLGHVRILMFDGVSPKRYLDFYKMKKPRKKDGKKIRVPFDQILPKNTLSLRGIPLLEKQVTADLIERKIITVVKI